MHAHLGLHEVGEHECDGAALALVAVHKSGASALTRRVDERRCAVEESSDILLLHVAHRAAQAPGYQSIVSHSFCGKCRRILFDVPARAGLCGNMCT